MGYEDRNYWHPGTAAVLSFFVCGTGQIYKGDLKRGLTFFAVYAVAMSLLLFFVPPMVYERTEELLKIIGFVVFLPVWIFGIFDAFDNPNTRAGWKI